MSTLREAIAELHEAIDEAIIAEIIAMLRESPSMLDEPFESIAAAYIAGRALAIRTAGLS